MFTQRLVCSWIGALGLAAGAFCQTYVQFNVDSEAFPASINEKGEIAGWYSDFKNHIHGFVRAPDGTIMTFDVPGSSITQARSINDEGAITGTYSVPVQPFVTHAYVRDPEGNFTTFDPPGSISTLPQSINAGGAVTGYYHGANRVDHGFVRRANGKLISFDPPGSTVTQAYSINAKGDITGSYGDGTSGHGFVRRPEGEIVSFEPSLPLSINNAGVITGNYFNLGLARYFGFVRDRQGNFTSFDPGLYTFPASINNEGAITGYFQPGQSGSVAHGFVRSPDGTITTFDPPFCLPGPETHPTSINDEGVITGLCLVSPSTAAAWVRFP